MKKRRIIYALLFLTVLLSEILIALFVNDNFVRPYMGDMLVTVLICSFFRVFIPKGVKLLPVYVFLFAAAVEVCQYFDIVKLFGLEGNRFISVLLGRTFSLADILCYAAGCILFFGVEKTVNYFVNSRKAM
ncbi:MAG: DUF2809 domain-containing protein [Ruminococcaceae bacterium]|nr:DUF2809 domain-containing protein [Oscillospiraceae bacterium]